MNRIYRCIALAIALFIIGISAGCTGTPGQGNATATPTTLAATTTATTTPTAAPTTSVPQSVTVNLTARNIAFDTTTIAAPRGAAVTINFDNQDSMPHNFALYTNTSASQAIYTGEIVTGPRQIVYTFAAPEQPGTYFFRCDVHPAQMTGEFVVT
ncbi:MAG: hypothetical protein EHJ95_01165 [Methanobacteriota archaeon]|nr:MAG: hypothetical protein EHJ95_01165 [Euryarchaeota archaeon]